MSRVIDETFPYKWEIDVPMRPCPDAECGKLHGGHIAVGAENGCVMLGLVSDLGAGALRLRIPEALELLENIGDAFGVALGMDMSDILDLRAEAIADAESWYEKRQEKSHG